MAFIREKTVAGKTRHYAEKTVRLPGGKVTKASVYLKDYDPKLKSQYLEEALPILEQKTSEISLNASVSRYPKSRIFPEETIRRIEESRLGYKKILNKLTKNQMQDVIDRFTANFTYESNAIEGNSLTLKDVTFLFKENRTPAGKDLREIHESINTREAMSRMFKGNFRIDHESIIRLHSILTKNTGISQGYKRLPNFLLGRSVKTASPEKVKSEMDALLGWYHENPDIHPLERAAWFHGKFEQIHPFEDGNGRTGRMIVNAMLVAEGYPPLIIRTSQRMSYFSALDAFDHRHEDKLKRFMIERYLDTYEKFFKVYVKYL